MQLGAEAGVEGVGGLIPNVGAQRSSKNKWQNALLRRRVAAAIAVDVGVAIKVIGTFLTFTRTNYTRREHFGVCPK